MKKLRLFISTMVMWLVNTNVCLSEKLMLLVPIVCTHSLSIFKAEKSFLACLSYGDGLVTLRIPSSIFQFQWSFHNDASQNRSPLLGAVDWNSSLLSFPLYHKEIPERERLVGRVPWGHPRKRCEPLPLSSSGPHTSFWEKSICVNPDVYKRYFRGCFAFFLFPERFLP